MIRVTSLPSITGICFSVRPLLLPCWAELSGRSEAIATNTSVLGKTQTKPKPQPPTMPKIPIVRSLHQAVIKSIIFKPDRDELLLFDNKCFTCMHIAVARGTNTMVQSLPKLIRKLITVEEFITNCDDSECYELIDSELTEMKPTGPHEQVARSSG